MNELTRDLLAGGDLITLASRLIEYVVLYELIKKQVGVSLFAMCRFM
jgi:hypothetical protein